MKLIFATDHVTRGGRTYKAGSTQEVNDHDSRALLIEGLARVAPVSKTAPVEGSTAAADNKKEAHRG